MKVSLYIQHQGLQISFMTADSDILEIFYNEHKFVSSTNKIKIAIIEPNYSNVQPFKQQLDRLLNKCDRIFVRSYEFQDVIDIIKEYDYDRIVYVIGGIINYPIKNATIVTECYFALSVSYPYIEELAWLNKEKTNAFVKKEHMFDVLYGMQHPHQLFVYDQLQKINQPKWFLENKFFNTTRAKNKNYTDFHHPDNSLKDWWEPEILETVNDNGQANYYGVYMEHTCFVPYKIYNKSAYSIVFESGGWDNDYAFFTEKITKPIIACRLFIVISSHKFLKNLRSLGFKTFNGIIDESYDEEIDNHTRWTMALEQAQWLCNQPQEDILKKIVPIVLHNLYNLRYLKHNQLSLEVEKFVQGIK